MDDSIQEWQSFRSWTTYNDNFTLGQCSFSSTHKWCYTNNIHDFQRKESRFLSIFPYRECSVISVLYMYLCYICAVCPALDFYITNLVTVFVMSWVMSLCTMPHCDVLFIAVSPIDLSPLKFIYHLLNHLLLNDPLFWSDRHRLNYSGTLVFWRG